MYPRSMVPRYDDEEKKGTVEVEDGELGGETKAREEKNAAGATEPFR